MLWAEKRRELDLGWEHRGAGFLYRCPGQLIEMLHVSGQTEVRRLAAIERYLSAFEISLSLLARPWDLIGRGSIVRAVALSKDCPFVLRIF